jgi:signal transduction histidine kinase
MVLDINLKVKRMSRLGLKFFSIILLVALGGLIFTSIYINTSIDNRFFDYLYLEEKEKIENLVTIIEETLDENENWIDVRMLAHDFIRINKVNLLLEDKNGDTIFNGQMGMMMNNMMSNNMMSSVHNNYLNRNSNKFKNNSEVIEIQYNGKTVANLYWETSSNANLSEKAEIFTNRVNKIIMIAAIFVSVLTILISYYFSRYLTRPLLQMNQIAGKIVKGDFDHHVGIKGKDELAELGQSFNDMVDKLKYLEKIRTESTSDLAHELRTPLATIKSYLEGIKEGILLADLDTIQEIEEELERLIKLVNRLGDLSDAEKSIVHQEVEKISFSEILQNIRDRFLPLAEKKGISIESKIEENLRITADPDNLESVIINLLSNAVKYTNEAGKILISLKKEDKSIIFRITDTGIGIGSEDLPYIFERFYRIDKSRSIKTGGTGIGLTISRELVYAMGGTIEVESPGINAGSTFIVTIPTVDN